MVSRDLHKTKSKKNLCTGIKEKKWRARNNETLSIFASHLFFQSDLEKGGVRMFKEFDYVRYSIRSTLHNTT